MKYRSTLLFVAALGPLVVVSYFAQQPGPVAPSNVPSSRANPSLAPIYGSEGERTGDEFLGTSLKGDRLATVLDEIPDPGERKAFVRLFEKRSPEERRKIAEGFLEQYPQSTFLSQAYEIAAKASIDLGDNKKALEYGGEALKLLPENPLLLAPIAGIQVKEGLLAEGAHNASLALDCLDRFRGPSMYTDKEWATIARQLHATSLYVLAEASLKEGVRASGSEQAAKLKEAEDLANQSWRLDPSDANTAYLLGLTRLARGNQQEAAIAFAAVYRQDGPLKARAEQRLRALYTQGSHKPQQGFDDFVRVCEAATQDPAAVT